MRTDGDQAEYKMVSIREIDVNAPLANIAPALPFQIFTFEHDQLSPSNPF